MRSLKARILAILDQIGDDLDRIARNLSKEDQAQLPELEEARRGHVDVKNALLEALGKKPDPGK